MFKTRELLHKLGKTNDNPKHPLEKMQILIDYIADNMENNEQDESAISELVYAAKKNITETIIDLKEEAHIPLNNHSLHFITGDSDVDNENTEALTDMFVLDPETTITNMLERQIQNGIEPEPVPDEPKISEEERARRVRQNAERAQEKLVKYRGALNLLKGKSIVYEGFEREISGVANDFFNLSEHFPLDEENPIENALADNKGGFFERFFRTTSREYKRFERLLEQRKNGEASREDLQNAAVAYLRRKIPGYDGEGLPSVGDINRLSGTAKKKAMLCCKTLMACQKSDEYESKLAIINGVAESNLRANGGYDAFQQMRYDNSYVIHGLDQLQQQPQNDQAVINEEQQVEFQNNLANDLNESEHQGGMYDDEFSDESSIHYDDDELDMNE